MKVVDISIVIPAYNHAKYIEQAVDSALAQDCPFSFEILIGDDCSTDETAEVCMKYQGNEQVKLISHPENLGLIKNYRSLFSVSKGKYIAILEGDDFWDLRKLSEQITFLKTNPEYGFIHSNAYFLYDSGRKKLVHNNDFNLEGEVYTEIFKANRIVAVTVCFRKELLDFIDFDSFESCGFKTLDFPLWLEFSMHTRLAYINKPLACYRITSESISNNKSFVRRKEFEESNRAIRNFYFRKYPVEGIDKFFIERNYNTKLYYLALRYGSYSDIRELKGKEAALSRFKKLAIENRIIFILFKLALKIFYVRI